MLHYLNFLVESGFCMILILWILMYLCIILIFCLCYSNMNSSRWCSQRDKGVSLPLCYWLSFSSFLKGIESHFRKKMDWWSYQNSWVEWICCNNNLILCRVSYLFLENILGVCNAKRPMTVIKNNFLTSVSWIILLV